MALVETARDGHVAVIRLNSDETRNALSTAMVDALVDALEHAEADPDVRAILLTVVADEELPQKALALARDLAALPPTSLQYAKQLVKSAWTQTIDEHLDQASALQALCHQTPEHAEAVKPFRG